MYSKLNKIVNLIINPIEDQPSKDIYELLV